MTLVFRRRLRWGVAAVVVVGCVTAVGSATATPVGPLRRVGFEHHRPGGHAPGDGVSGTFRVVRARLAWRPPGRSRRGPTLWDADVGASVVVVYRAVGVGRATVVYALTRGETVKALQALRYRVVVVAPRCSALPQAAAEYVIPPPPFVPRIVSVRTLALPTGEPVAGGPLLKRLYRVTFDVRTGNAVLPAGYRYSQFAYVGRKKITAPGAS